MKHLYIILLILPLIGFGQDSKLNNIPLLDPYGRYSYFDSISNGNSKNLTLQVYYKENKRPDYMEGITFLDGIGINRYEEIRYGFNHYRINFHNNGNIESITISYFGNRYETIDSISYNENGLSNQYTDPSRFEQFKQQHIEVGNYYYNISRLDSMKQDSKNIISVLLEYDKLLNRYYQILRKQLNENDFLELKEKQYKWLERRGKLITVFNKNKIKKINTQLDLYESKLREFIDMFNLKLNTGYVDMVSKNLDGGVQCSYSNIHGEELYIKCYNKNGQEIDCE